MDRLGGLLVNDTKANTIFRLRPPVSDGAWTREVFLRPSGTFGPHPPGVEHGANGLALEAPEATGATGGPGGIYVVSPQGTFRERVGVDPLASNVEFGEGSRALFATTGDRVVRFHAG